MDDDDKRDAAKHVVSALGAAVALLGVFLLDSRWQPEPTVAEPSTRVGGATRVETSLEAAQFWPSGAGFVAARARSGNQHLFNQAWCGVEDEPKPLLLVPPGTGPRRLAVQEQADLLGSDDLAPTKCSEPPEDRIECPKEVDEAGAWSVFGPEDSLPLPAVPDWAPICPSLFDTVILATAKSERHAPDVAVALVLAANMAHGSSSRDPQNVTVIVLPRHLAADVALADALRDRPEQVTRGIVMGQVNRISSETRETVRALLTGSAERSWWQRTREALPSIVTLVEAFLFFWFLKHGVQALAPTVVAVGPSVIKRIFTWWRPSPPVHPTNPGPESKGDGIVPTQPAAPSAANVVPTEALGLLRWPTPAADLKDREGNAATISLNELLQALQLLATDTDRSQAAGSNKWDDETPGSMQVIKSGTLQITKTGTKFVAGAGGITGALAAVAGSISAFRDDVGEPVTVTLLGGAALIFSSIAIALAIFVKGDLEARGVATAARHQGRAEVASAFLSVTGGIPGVESLRNSEDNQELLTDFFNALAAHPDRVRVQTRHSKDASHIKQMSRSDPRRPLRLILASGDEIGVDEITGFTTES